MTLPKLRCEECGAAYLPGYRIHKCSTKDRAVFNMSPTKTTDERIAELEEELSIASRDRDLLATEVQARRDLHQSFKDAGFMKTSAELHNAVERTKRAVNKSGALTRAIIGEE